MKVKRWVIISIIAVAVIGAVVAGIFLFGETIMLNIFGGGNESGMPPECEAYAMQSGMDENTDCEGADKEKCMSFCTSYPQCCENMSTGAEEQGPELTECDRYGMQIGMNETTDCEGADMQKCISYCDTYPQFCQNQSGS